MFGGETDPREIAESEEQIPKILTLIDGWIGEYGYVAGTNLTIADFVVFE